MKEQDHFPLTAGSAHPNEPQDPTSPLGHKWHCWAPCYPPDLQVLSPRATFQQPVLVHGLVLPQWQNLTAFAFKEFQRVLLCPCFQPTKVFLKSCTTLWCICHSPQCVFCVLLSCLSSCEAFPQHLALLFMDLI